MLRQLLERARDGMDETLAPVEHFRAPTLSSLQRHAFI
jgi:hypothetical protein